jgi:hypothetical protein
MAYLLPYLPTLLHLHTLYIDFSIVLLTVRLFMCNSVLLSLSHCYVLSWPGHRCKWVLVLNWPTWLNNNVYFVFAQLVKTSEVVHPRVMCPIYPDGGTVDTQPNTGNAACSLNVVLFCSQNDISVDDLLNQLMTRNDRVWFIFFTSLPREKCWLSLHNNHCASFYP